MEPVSSSPNPNPKPFSKEGFKYTLSRIIFFYSVFYIVIKIVAVGKGEALLPQLILVLPFLLLAGLGYWHEKNKQYKWWYVIVGIIVISAIRFYETDLLEMLNTYL